MNPQNGAYLDVSPEEAQGLLAQGALTILDMRDSASQAQGHLAGAQPASDAAMKQLIMRRPRQHPVLVYCYHGNSSRELCQFIAGLGFSRVYNLAGGWQAWQAALGAAPRGDAADAHAPALADWMSRQGFPAGQIHARIGNGMSPLMLAALQGEKALVEALLALGADPNHVNDDDHHALWFACVHGDADLVARLIQHGANVDNQNVNGATCAIYAASTGKLAVLKQLVQAGADLGKETTGGYTALESASTLPVLRYLRALSPERPVLAVA